MGKLGEGVADLIVDGAFTDLAAFDVGDGDAEGEGDGGGGEHLVAIGDEEEEVGAHLAEGVGEAEAGEAEGLGHAGVGVGGEEALDAGGDGEAVALDLCDGRAELGREMGGEDDELEVDVGMGGEVFEGPVEMAVVGAGAGDDGDGSLHAGATSLSGSWQRSLGVGM